jgi:hypothetical protein
MTLGGLALADPRVALVDLQYHDVNRSRGLFYRMQKRGLIERIVTDDDIAHAVEYPPETTRARLRGEFIRRAKERKRDYTVDWVHLKLNDQAQRTVLCKDPFKAHDERVEAHRQPLTHAVHELRPSAMTKLERLLNLIAALIHTVVPMTAEIREEVEVTAAPTRLRFGGPSGATKTSCVRWASPSRSPLYRTDPPLTGPDRRARM